MVMKPIRKLLLATDFSPPADVALQQAMNIARHAGAELVIAHAHPVTAAQSTIAQTARLHSDVITQVSQRAIADAHRQLEQLFERVTDQGVKVSTLLVDSPAGDGIATAAREVGADLVVVGSQGRTGLSRLFLGSVAEKILRACDVSVLIARNSAGAGGFRRLAVATACAPRAASAVETARGLAAPGAVMQLLHCWQIPAIYSEYATALVPVAAELAKEADATGDKWVSRYRAPGLDVRFVSLQGAPAHTIVQQLSEDPADMVLLGSHGRRGFERLLLGSVAERVARHAPCSVLIVRDPDADRWGEDPGKGNARP
jgi:nucleotide-binding universal stress UspA family protein